MSRRNVAVIALALASLGSSAAGAPAAPSDNASCVAALVAFEAHLAPGFIGAEQQASAPQSAGAIGAAVSTLAQAHGSLPACVAG
jgi:hypothetical protein